MQCHYVVWYPYNTIYYTYGSLLLIVIHMILELQSQVESIIMASCVTLAEAVRIGC